MKTKWLFGAGAALAACAVWGAAPAAAAPTLGQVIDFESGQTQGFTNGGGATDPVNVTTGGPAGANDNFLRVTARGGSGAGSRLVTFNNNSRWTGNYTTAGVTSVTMDLKNFGTTPLLMRIALEGTGSTYYASSTGFALPADGAWHTARFDLDTTHLTRVQGTAALNTVLTGVSELRILHTADPDFRGDAINSAFGVDNIAAVPEPAALGLVAGGAALLLRRRRGK